MMLYHFTYCDNLPFIRQDGALLPAAELLDACGLGGCKSEKRRDSCTLPDGRILRDQKPLQAGHIDFAPDFTMANLVALINAHVFFWHRFIPTFANKYRDNALICCDLADVKKRNSGKAALCCQYNSGAPRTSHGKKSPRGPNTFESLDDVWRSCKEVVFYGKVRLPDNYEVMMPEEWHKKLTNLP